MIYVRADGNSRIGMGHVMRCLAISKELVSKGEQVTFIVADTGAADLIEKSGYKCHVLGTEFTEMETEIPGLMQILPEGAKVLIDSYFVTENYLKAVKEKRTIFYMDDLDAVPYPVDCVVNGNIYGGDIVYNVPKVLGGCKYAPLRREYVEARGRVNPQHILITTGSSDPYSITKKVVEGIEMRPALLEKPIKIVCGRFNADFEEIKAYEQKYSNVEVLQNVPDMWNLMSGAMLAVTAGGTTMNELSCMGVPVVCFSFVDNQERIVTTYVEKGYAYFGGDYLKEGDEMIQYLCNSMEELVQNEDLRRFYSEKVSSLVDGLGSVRIAEAIINYRQ